MYNHSCTSNLCMHTATLWKDKIFMHPKQRSHVGTTHSFDKAYITRSVKITDYHTDFFFSPWQYAYESTAGRIDIFLSVWKPQGFSTPGRGKKKQMMGIFSEPYCLPYPLLETRGWREQKFPQSE